MHAKTSMQIDSFPVALNSKNEISHHGSCFPGIAALTFALGMLLAISQPLLGQRSAVAEFQANMPLAPPTSPVGPSGPFGVALDKAGDLFLTDYNYNRVLEIPVGCESTACQITVPTNGLYGPTAIALDASGNIFIADYHNNRVVEVPRSGSGFGTQFALPTTGQNLPTGLALDSAGDLYIANNDYVGTTPSRVVELPWNGSGYGPPVTIVNWLGNPSGLALDGAGDLFVTDVVANEVVELPKGCSNSSCQIMVTSGVSTNDPGVATDSAGDVFVAYFGGNKVLEIPSGCTTAACQIQVGYGLNEPAGVAVDGKGNIFIADYQNGRIVKVRLNSFDFGTIDVGSSSTVDANFTFNSSATLNTAAPYSVLTQGASGLDFVGTGSGTCSATTYGAGQSCDLQVNFTPTRAGSVAGALVLSDSSGTVVATAYLHGTGSGPQLTFTPGSRTSIGAGLGSSSGIALDRKGNIFVADSANRAVEELLAPAYSTRVTLGGSFTFSNPVRVALDGAGNVFVADSGATSIEEILAPAYTTVRPLGSGFNTPAGITVDGSGNIYVADSGNNAIKEMLQVDDYGAVSALASGFSSPSGVAVDADGNAYVADTGNNAIKQILAVDGSIPNSPVIKTLASGFSAPIDVALDAALNLYVADRASDAVDELTAFSGYANMISLGGGFGGPSSLGLDSDADIYVGSSGNNQVVKFNYSDPPSLKFAASVGATSSPQTVTIINSGNADLTVPAPASGYNPSISAGFAIQTSGGSTAVCPLLTSSSGSATLTAGNSCTDQITFSPNAPGTISGALVFTDDNLNVAGSTQAISLTGIAATITLSPTSLTTGQVGVPYTQALIASGDPGPYNFSITQGSLPGGLGLSASGVISGTPSSAGSFSFTITATSTDTIDGSQAYTMTVSAPAITLAPASLPAAQVNLAYSQTLTASGGTSPYAYQVTSGALPSGITLSSTGLFAGTPSVSGTFTFTIGATDSSAGTGAPFSVSKSYTLAVSPPTITIAPNTLPNGQVGTAYPLVSLAAGGGTGPYTFRVTSGALPAGLALGSSGLLSGTATQGGSFTFTVTATDASNYTGSQTYSVTLSGATLTITPSTLPVAQLSTAYNQTLSASGGTAPYKLVVTGALPAGMTFNSATATLSGTPTAGGSFPISVGVTDSSTGSGPYTASANYTLTVNPGTAVLTFAPIPPQTYGNPPFKVSATSASSGAITYGIVSGPATIDPSTGMVTLNGAGQVTIEATQAATPSYNSTIAQTPLNIARQGSITILTVNPLLLSLGQKVTLTATVTPAIMGAPTGTVTFFDGQTQIGTPVTLTNGVATLTTSNLPSGLNVISAVYNGDSNFLGSNAVLSSPLIVEHLDFSFLASGTSTQTVMPGGAATFEFTLTPSNTNYPGTVTFSVSGLPSGAKTIITPTTVLSTAGLQTVTLTIHSPTGSTGPILASESHRRYAPFALALFVPLLGLWRARRKLGKRLNGFILMMLISAACLSTWPLSGCGAVSGVLGHSYSVAVTATSGDMQHTAYVDFTVK